MKRLGKRFAAVVCMILAIGALSGCGSEDKVGYVDMARVQKEAPMVQQYQKKMEDKDKALNDELQKDKQSMSEKTAAGPAGTADLCGQHAAAVSF